MGGVRDDVLQCGKCRNIDFIRTLWMDRIVAYLIYLNKSNFTIYKTIYKTPDYRANNIEVYLWHKTYRLDEMLGFQKWKYSW